MKRLMLIVLLGTALSAAAAAEPQPNETDPTWLDTGEMLAAAAPDEDATMAPAPTGQSDERLFPGLPVCWDQWLAGLTDKESQLLVRHTIEGAGGGVIVPTAYLLNPGEEGTIVGMPVVSASYFGDFDSSQKNVTAFAVSMTFLRRFEIGYALDRHDLGKFPGHVKRLLPGNDIREARVVLHNWHLRMKIIDENQFGLPLPQLTTAFHWKYNSTIDDINDRLGVPMDVMGYDRACSFDWTMHASKRFHFDPVPPIVLTVGFRNSEAAHAGFMGFSDHRSVTFETSVAVVPFDWMSVQYEFRRKEYPYDNSRAVANGAPANLLTGEDNWHSLNASFLIFDGLVFNTGVNWFGQMHDNSGDGALNFQVVYNF